MATGNQDDSSEEGGEAECALVAPYSLLSFQPEERDGPRLLIWTTYHMV